MLTASQRRWLLVLCMMVITFVFGTDLLSSENTRPILRWIMQWLFGQQPDSPKIGTGEGLIRKSAHFLEYALLAYLWFRALRGDQTHVLRWTWLSIAWIATILWATVDELQQAFISQHRTGSVWDVLLDSCGGLTALLLVVLTTSLFRRQAGPNMSQQSQSS